MSIVHPVVCSQVINPVVDVLNPVAWRAGSSGAGQTLAQRLAALGVLYAWAPTGQADVGVPIIGELDWGYTGNQYNADGVSVGLNPAWFPGKGAWAGDVRQNVFATLPAAGPATVTLTATTYTLQCFDSGSVSCSYGTATPGSHLTFTATAGPVVFTPSDAGRWMLQVSAYANPYVPPGVISPYAAGTTTGNGMSIPLTADLIELFDGQHEFTMLANVTPGFDTYDTGGLNVVSHPPNEGLRIASYSGAHYPCAFYGFYVQPYIQLLKNDNFYMAGQLVLRDGAYLKKAGYNIIRSGESVNNGWAWTDPGTNTHWTFSAQTGNRLYVALTNSALPIFIKSIVLMNKVATEAEIQEVYDVIAAA